MSKVTIGIEDTDFEHPDVLVQLKAGLRHDVIGKECTVLLTNAGIEIERLRAALEFYAHAPHYVMQGWEIARDGGAKAREALINTIIDINELEEISDLFVRASGDLTAGTEPPVNRTTREDQRRWLTGYLVASTDVGKIAADYMAEIIMEKICPEVSTI